MSAPCRLQVDRREVSTGCDAARGEVCLDAVSVGIFGKANDIDEPTDGAAGKGKWGRGQARKLAEKGIVAFGCDAAEREYFADSTKLHAAQRASQIGEPVVESDFGVIEPACVWV